MAPWHWSVWTKASPRKRCAVKLLDWLTCRGRRPLGRRTSTWADRRDVGNRADRRTTAVDSSKRDRTAPSPALRCRREWTAGTDVQHSSRPRHFLRRLCTQNNYVRPPHTRTKMYAGRVASSPLVSHVENASRAVLKLGKRRNRQTDGRTDWSQTVTSSLPAKRNQYNKSLTGRLRAIFALECSNMPTCKMMR